MALAHFRMLIHELLKKYPDIVPEEDTQIILDSRYAVCIANNGKYTQGTLLEEYIFKGMVKNTKCTILTCVKEV